MANYKCSKCKTDWNYRIAYLVHIATCNPTARPKPKHKK